MIFRIVDARTRSLEPHAATLPNFCCLWQHAFFIPTLPDGASKGDFSKIAATKDCADTYRGYDHLLKTLLMLFPNNQTHPQSTASWTTTFCHSFRVIHESIGNGIAKAIHATQHRKEMIRELQIQRGLPLHRQVNIPIPSKIKTGNPGSDYLPSANCGVSCATFMK